MTRFTTALPALVAVILTLPFVACGGSVESDSSSSPTSSVTITMEDLPNLVLDLDQVSVDGTVLPYDPEDSGPKSRESYAEGFDSEWLTEVLETYNWQATYYQDFGIGTQDSPVFNGSVSLELYDSPENAAGAVSERFNRVTQWEGQTFSGNTAQFVEVFDVPELGARGLKIGVVTSSGIEYVMTNIDFVRGPLVVDIGTASTDDRDLGPATLELARLAEARLAEAGLTAP